MAEPIEMPFEVWTWVGSGNHAVSGGLDPPGQGAVWEGAPCDVAFQQPFIRIL